MQIEARSLERDSNAPSWCDPIAMLISWLTRILGHIASMKRIRRTTQFKPGWQDHFANLRQCEWLRDQTLAAGAAQLVANQPLDLSSFIPIAEPTANYGGPCPRTPFEMNRRFLAVARFNADPETAIRTHAARIARRAGIDPSSPLSAHGSTDAQLHCAAHHEAGVHCNAGTLLPLMVSSAQCARPSNHEGQQRAPPGARGCARGPPQPSRPVTYLAAACEIAPVCPDRSAAHQITETPQSRR